MSHLSPAAEPFSNPGLHADAGPDWAAGPWKDGAADGAAVAHYHAEIASKCATELAAYFQSLWGTVIHLQHKVQELEDWKKKALEDVRKLRDEHKVLRRKVLGEEPVEHVRSSVRAKTMPPALVPMVTDSPPPGLSPKNDSPPGLKVPNKEVSFATKSSLSSGHSSTSLTMASMYSDTDPGHLDGVQLSSACVDGLDLERAEWRIGQLSQKLRGCMGSPLPMEPSVGFVPGQRGPERFFYDKTTYTGVHTCGGPSTVCKDSFLASLRNGLQMSLFVRNPGLQPRPLNLQFGGRSSGPERFFYDRSSYTGVHLCGGPSVNDKENDPDGNFCRSLRPKRCHSQPNMRPGQIHRSRPADSNVRFLQKRLEDTPRSLGQMRLALLNSRLQRDRFGDHLPEEIV